MAANLPCPVCNNVVGNCGHVAGGYTGPITLGGTCTNCGNAYRVTCYGGCV